MPFIPCRSAAAGGGFALTDLRTLHFRFEGGRRSPFDELDDWDMRTLIVQVEVARPGGPRLTVPLLRIEDRAIHRFEDVDSWSIDVPR